MNRRRVGALLAAFVCCGFVIACTPKHRTVSTGVSRILLNNRIDIDSFFMYSTRYQAADRLREEGLEVTHDSLPRLYRNHPEIGFETIAARNVTLLGITGGRFDFDWGTRNDPFLLAVFTHAPLPRDKWQAVRDSFDYYGGKDGSTEIFQGAEGETLRGIIALRYAKLVLECDSSGLKIEMFRLAFGEKSTE